MEFDKSRIYTCVNADELKIGSRVIFADTLYDLMYKVCDPNFDDFSILEKVMSPEFKSRFIGHTKTSVCATNAYLLAYLVEEKPKFDITKVLYHDNCKEAIIGKKYFYAEDLHRLRLHVEENDIEFSGELLEIEEINIIPFYLSTSKNTLWELIYPMED